MDRHNLYLKAILLYYPLFTHSDNKQLRTLQLSCTLHQTIYLALQSTLGSHIIAHLNEGFYVCTLSGHEMHFLVVTRPIVEERLLCIVSPTQRERKTKGQRVWNKNKENDREQDNSKQRTRPPFYIRQTMATKDWES